MRSPYRHRVPFSYCHRRYTIFRLGCGIQSEPDADDLVICLYNVVVGGRTERRSAQPDAKAFKLSSYCPATEHYTSRHWRFWTRGSGDSVPHQNLAIPWIGRTFRTSNCRAGAADNLRLSINFAGKVAVVDQRPEGVLSPGKFSVAPMQPNNACMHAVSGL